jgi:hypothetical protein
MKTSVVKHYFINESEIKDSHLAQQLKINHSLVLGDNNIGGYFDNAEDAIKTAYRNQEQFVILHWQSSYFELGSINKILVEYENLFDYEHAVYAHIVDNKTKDGRGWFGFIPVTVALDLKLLKYSSEDEIKFGEPQNTPAEVSMVERSPNNVHDNYTPLWLRGLDSKVKVEVFTRPGWKLIDYAASKNLEIMSLGGNVRKLKTHLYGTDHSEDFNMMSRVIEQIGIMENKTMCDWFLRMLSNNQNSVVGTEIMNEKFLDDSVVLEGKNIVIHPSLKDIQQACQTFETLHIVTESYEEYSKLKFLFNDKKVLEKYGYSIDIAKCKIIQDDIFKNKKRFVRYCKDNNIDTVYLKGLIYRRNNIGLNSSVNFMIEKLKDTKIYTL